MTIHVPMIPLWFVAAMAGIWAALALWQWVGQKGLIRSRDQKRLEQVTTTADDDLAPIKKEGLADELAQAGVDMNASTFNLLRGAGVALGLLVGPVLGLPLLVSAALGLGAWFGPRRWVARRVQTRGLAIDEALPQALSRLAALLPLITSMPRLLMTVAESLRAIDPASPLAAELQQTAVDLRDRGPDAFERLEARAPSSALATLAFNLRVYVRSGGEQSELLAQSARRLQRLINGRNKARSKAANALAAARLLPMLLGGTMLFTLQDPQLRAFWLSLPGQILILVIAGMMLVGYQIIQQMVEDVV